MALHIPAAKQDVHTSCGVSLCSKKKKHFLMAGSDWSGKRERRNTEGVRGVYGEEGGAGQ